MKGKHLAVLGGVLLLDQLSKILVRALLDSEVRLLPFFYLNFQKNTGGVFSILQGKNTMLIFLSMIVIGLIVFFIDRFKKEEMLGIALVLAGAIGNLIDRISLGYVVDFLDFRIWPVFNLADSAITVGVFLLLYNSIASAYRDRAIESKAVKGRKNMKG